MTLQQRVDAAIRKFVGKLITKAALAELQSEVAKAMRASAKEEVARLCADVVAEVSKRAPKPPRELAPTVVVNNVVHRDTKPANALQRPQSTGLTANGKQPPTCKKCGFVGGNSRGCGRSHPTQGAKAETPASDPEEEGEPVELVSDVQLEVDAKLPKVAPGNATITDPRLGIDRHEVCAIHGWVGRRAFQDDRHDLCAPQINGVECNMCRGRKFTIGGRPCSRCGGAGVMPADQEPTTSDLEDIEAEADDDIEVVEAEPGLMRVRRRPCRTRPRATSEMIKRLRRDFLLEESHELAEEIAEMDASMPKTRGDCVDGDRPCLHFRCRHNLVLDISPDTGTIKLNNPDREPWELEHTCALDVADDGPITLERVAAMTNITRERVRQIEVKALFKARFAATCRGIAT